MEKKFYEMPELKIVDLEGEVLLSDSNDPDGVEQDKAPVGGMGDGDGDVKRESIWEDLW